MKTKLIFPAAILLLAAACNKPDASKPTGCAQGTLTVVNDSADIYAVYVDSTFQLNLASNTSHNFTLDTGTHLVRTLQVTGNRTMPDHEGSLPTITGCNTYIFKVR